MVDGPATPSAPVASIGQTLDLGAALTTAFATAGEIPANHRGALIFAADKTGAHAIVAERLDASGAWQVQGYVTRQWTGNLEYGVQLVTTW